MLLVKSKELKNLNKKSMLSPLLAGLSAHSKSAFIFVISAFPSALYAQEQSSAFSSSSSIVSVFLSLLVVIAIIFALAYVMRRFNVAQAGNGQMKVVASMMAGNKEKIMVVEVGDEQYLLGITAHNINHLATLNEPLKHSKSNSSARANATSSSTKVNFQQKLISAMAQSMTEKNPTTKKASNSQYTVKEASND